MPASKMRDAHGRTIGLAGATALAIAALCATAPTLNTFQPLLVYDHVQDELLVFVKVPEKPSAATAFNAELVSFFDSFELDLVRYHPIRGMALARLRSGSGDAALLAKATDLAARDDVVRTVEPNLIGTLLSGPNDPLFTAPYPPKQWAPQKISAPGAWALTQGKPDVVVAVIDSGIAHGLADLQGNFWVNPCEDLDHDLQPDDGGDDTNGADDPCAGGASDGYKDDFQGWNFVDGSNVLMDQTSHGSNMAGVIGGVGDNGQGIAGISWKVALMDLKVAGTLNTKSEAAIAAVDYARFHGADVINASWSIAPSPELEKAIADAGSAGIVFVAASGNDGVDVDASGAVRHFPCDSTVGTVVCVASTTEVDDREASSNYGKTSVDLGAPGEDVISTGSSGNYNSASGTSMAAPHASGVAALVRARCPEASAQDVKDRLLDGDWIKALDEKTVSERRLNAQRAVDRRCARWSCPLDWPRLLRLKMVRLWMPPSRPIVLE
jgi:subtilisin family serine protease